MRSQDLLRVCMEVFVSGCFFVAVSALIFWPLEEILEHEKSARPKLKDLAYLWFYQSYGLWIAAGIVFEIAFRLMGLLPGHWINVVQQQPFWLQAAEAWFMAVIGVYTAHRLAHRSDFL